jgi:hypothetical protein
VGLTDAREGEGGGRKVGRRWHDVPFIEAGWGAGKGGSRRWAPHGRRRGGLALCLASNGPRPTGASGWRVRAWRDAGQGRAGVADPWAPGTVPGGGLDLFQIQIQNEFESDSKFKWFK